MRELNFWLKLLLLISPMAWSAGEFHGQLTPNAESGSQNDAVDCGEVVKRVAADAARVDTAFEIRSWLGRCNAAEQRAKTQDLTTLILRTRAESLFEGTNRLLQDCPNLMSKLHLNSEKIKTMGQAGLDALKTSSLERVGALPAGCEGKYQTAFNEQAIVDGVLDEGIQRTIDQVSACKKDVFLVLQKKNPNIPVEGINMSKLYLYSLTVDLTQHKADLAAHCPQYKSQLMSWKDYSPAQ